jgi:acetyltransferase-like isoleucine patch superfamily enzyme
VVDHAILWRDTIIEADCIVRDAVLGERCRLGHHTEVGPGVILGSDSILSAHSRVPGTR